MLLKGLRGIFKEITIDFFAGRQYLSYFSDGFSNCFSHSLSVLPVEIETVDVYDDDDDDDLPLAAPLLPSRR